MGFLKSCRHKIRLTLAMKLPEWILLAEAWRLQIVFTLALRRVSYQDLLARIKTDPSKKIAPGNLLDVSRRMLQIVSWAARGHCFTVTCLVRAMTLHSLLTRKGIDSRICIGVSKPDDRWLAHAWVEVDGIAFGEAQDITEKYQVLEPPA